jgi:hypothetical protein
MRNSHDLCKTNVDVPVERRERAIAVEAAGQPALR